MTDEDLDLLNEMFTNCIKSLDKEGNYVDPKAKEKADVLKKVIDLFSDKDKDIPFSGDIYTYKTRDKRNFLSAIYGDKMVLALYEILCWRRNLLNGKDYGKGSVIYRSKLLSSDEWERKMDVFNKDREIEYDYTKKVYKDSLGEVPSEEVFHVYTREQIEDELDYLLSDVKDLVYQLME